MSTARAELLKQLTHMARGVDRFQREIMDLPLPSAPSRLPADRKKFRHLFILEEVDEFNTANNFSDEIDALTDAIYVAVGGLLEMGVNPEAAFDPVQEKNMQKLRGETKRGHAYDAIKPDGWTPPDHEKVVEELALRAQVSEPLLEATRIVIERNAAYNHGEQVRREDHFPFGMLSLFQMMWVKMKRMESDLLAGRPPKRDHLIDLINYAAFAVNFLDGRPM